LDKVFKPIFNCRRCKHTYIQNNDNQTLCAHCELIIKQLRSAREKQMMWARHRRTISARETISSWNQDTVLAND